MIVQGTPGRSIGGCQVWLIEPGLPEDCPEVLLQFAAPIEMFAPDRRDLIGTEVACRRPPSECISQLI